jgi:hypothetical protein
LQKSQELLDDERPTGVYVQIRYEERGHRLATLGTG